MLFSPSLEYFRLSNRSNSFETNVKMYSNRVSINLNTPRTNTYLRYLPEIEIKSCKINFVRAIINSRSILRVHRNVRSSEGG